jgi:hypothetical protein
MSVDEDLIGKDLETSEIDQEGMRHRLYRHPAASGATKTGSRKGRKQPGNVLQFHGEKPVEKQAGQHPAQVVRFPERPPRTVRDQI